MAGRQFIRAARQWRNMRRFLLGTLVGVSLSGCGGGSSQSLQNGVAVQQSGTDVSTTSIPASSGASTGCSAASFVPNFAAETDAATGLPNQLHHWKAFPARVYFAPNAFLTPERKAQALAGFGWWAQATNAAARYQEVDAATSANIVVQFEIRGETHYGAVTEYHFNSKGELLDGTITFNMTYLTSVANITPVAAHEFGHALGIGGHSGDLNDVMSSTSEVYRRTALSVRDVNTLKTAYCGLPDALPSSGTVTLGSSKGTGQASIIRCGLDVR